MRKINIQRQTASMLIFIVTVWLLPMPALADTTDIQGFRILAETYNTAELEIDYFYDGKCDDAVYITARIFSRDQQPVVEQGFNLFGEQVVCGKQSSSLFQGRYTNNPDKQESSYIEIKLYYKKDIRNVDNTILTKQFPYRRTWFREELQARQEAPDFFESRSCSQEVFTSNEQFPSYTYLDIDAIASLPKGVVILGGSYTTRAEDIQSVFFVSRDEGISWTKIPIAISQATIEQFQTANDSHIWALASIKGEGHTLAQYLLKSSDAGANWECLELNVAGVYRGEGVGYFRFFDENHGLIMSQNAEGDTAISHTRDGGRHWQLLWNASLGWQIESVTEFTSCRESISPSQRLCAPVWRSEYEGEYRISGRIRVRGEGNEFIIEAEDFEHDDVWVERSRLSSEITQ